MLFSLVLLASSVVRASAHSVPRQRHHNARHRNIARASAGSTIESDAPAGGFKIVGNSGVSAQMLFLGTKDTVYILDKAENNSMTIGGHPAWGTKYNVLTNEVTPMDVSSNTFCAAGMSVANGSWVVFGGNQDVVYHGEAVSDKNKNPTGANPYGNTDGGKAVRLLTPCDDDSCQWAEGGANFTMTSRRWYPSTEGLADGSIIVLGGDEWGGYVATKGQNNPTYEYWPARGDGKAIHMDFLDYTLPLALYPLVWLMPSGKLFLQANYKSILYDMDTKTETALPDMPHAARVYPASGGAAMLPLTPANNYTAEVLFCGGSAADLSKSTDAGVGYNVTAVRADDSCVRIRPDDEKPEYHDDDSLPEGRSMGSLVYLPDGTMWLGNGVEYGTAGYGSENYSIGVSYGQQPLYTPTVYDPNAASGSRWSRNGFKASTEERMYHSTAILLADGSIMVSGSNPNADVTTEGWPTKYSVEKWYPTWYNEPRPVHSGFPDKLSYGGDAWNLTLTDKNADPSKIKIAVIRTGFSTHGINFGQRYLELETSYKQNKETGEITIHASQMPPNANLFTPGPAMIFLVVNGIPSEGEMVIIGSGNIEKQPIGKATVLPESETTGSDSADKTKSAQSNSPNSTVAHGGSTDDKSGNDSQDKKVGTNNLNASPDSAASSLASPILAVVVGIIGAAAWL